MYQYDSKGKAQSEKPKEITTTTMKSHAQAGIKMPVQPKSPFRPSLSQENGGENTKLDYTSRPRQLMPISYSPLQMQLVPKQEKREIQPLPMTLNEEQRRLASNFTKPNNTGIPLQMKERFENLSGFSFDDVKVHYNSDKPAYLQALAYTQGNQVYVAPGQEKYLGHELGHVVQQKRGGVKPTGNVGEQLVNMSAALEHEADMWGDCLHTMTSGTVPQPSGVAQFIIGVQPVGTLVVKKPPKDLGDPVPIGTTTSPAPQELSTAPDPCGEIYKIDNRTDNEERRSITYILSHIIRRGLIETAGANDPQYDVFLPAPQTPGEPTGSGVSGASLIARQNSRVKVEQNFHRLLKPLAVNLENRVMEIERTTPGHEMFYHALGVGAYALHRVIQALYEIQMGGDFTDYTLIRSKPKLGVSSGLHSMQEIQQAPRNGINDRSEKFKKVLLSVNLSLFANIDSPPESTFEILKSGGLFGVNKNQIHSAIDGMLQFIGADPAMVQFILNVVNALFKNIIIIESTPAEEADKRETPPNHTPMGVHKKEAVLYQIAIPQQLVDKLVYISGPYGKPLDENLLLKMEQVLGAVIAANCASQIVLDRYGKMDEAQKSEYARSAEFTKLTLRAAKNSEFWMYFIKNNVANEPQARILMNPEYFPAPTGQVRIFTHKLLSGRTDGVIEGAITAIKQIGSKLKQFAALAVKAPNAAGGWEIISEGIKQLEIVVNDYVKANDDVSTRAAASGGMNALAKLSASVDTAISLVSSPPNHPPIHSSQVTDKDDYYTYDNLIKILTPIFATATANSSKDDTGKGTSQ